MSLKKKFNIKNLDINKKFHKNSHIVLEDKLKKIYRLLKKYLLHQDPENLHQLRIAVRKFRYVSEIFVVCFKEKEFQILYNRIKELQDILGKGRDVDVFTEKLKIYNNEMTINKNLINKLEKEREQIYSTIKEELVKFANQKKQYFTLLKNK